MLEVEQGPCHASEMVLLANIVSGFNNLCLIYKHFNVNCMISISRKRQKSKRRK